MLLDPAAFTTEYTEEQELKGQLAYERNLIKEVTQLLVAEKAKEQPKFARIARDYCERIQNIFWYGLLKQEAQMVLEDLYTLQTAPLNDLMTHYEVIDGQYQDSDPLEVLKEIKKAKEHEDQLAQDEAEVMDAVQLIEGEKSQYKMDPRLFSIANKIVNANDPNPVEVVVLKDEKPTGLEAEVLQNAGPYMADPEDEPEVWYEDGELTSVPLSQNNTMEMKGTMDLPRLQAEMYPFVKAIRDLNRQVTKKWQEKQREFVYLLQEMASDKLTSPDYWKNPIFDEWWLCRIIARDKKKTDEGFAWYSLTKLMEDQPDRVHGRPWSLKLGKDYPRITLWMPRVREEVENSQEAKNFIRQLALRSEHAAPEDVAYVFLGIQPFLPQSDVDGDDESSQWETLEIARDIPLVGYPSLYEFLDMWGDDILEEAIYRDGGLKVTGTEQIERVARAIEQDYLDHTPSNKTAKTKEERWQSREFMQGVFNAVGASQAELMGAGDENWRREVSAIGNKAYHAMLEATGDFKKAWRCFWNAGKIVSVGPDGVTVKSGANGQTQRVNYGIAQWKLKNHEIALTKVERAHLKALLKSKGWGKALLGVL